MFYSLPAPPESLKPNEMILNNSTPSQNFFISGPFGKMQNILQKVHVNKHLAVMCSNCWGVSLIYSFSRESFITPWLLEAFTIDYKRTDAFAFFVSLYTLSVTFRPSFLHSVDEGSRCDLYSCRDVKSLPVGHKQYSTDQTQLDYIAISSNFGSITLEGFLSPICSSRRSEGVWSESWLVGIIFLILIPECATYHYFTAPERHHIVHFRRVFDNIYDLDVPWVLPSARPTQTHPMAASRAIHLSQTWTLFPPSCYISARAAG